MDEQREYVIPLQRRSWQHANFTSSVPSPARRGSVQLLTSRECQTHARKDYCTVAHRIFAAA